VADISWRLHLRSRAGRPKLSRKRIEYAWLLAMKMMGMLCIQSYGECVFMLARWSDDEVSGCPRFCGEEEWLEHGQFAQGDQNLPRSAAAPRW
jgi:hypothetical protein